LNIPDDHPARDPLDNFYLATAGVAGAGIAVAGGGPRLLRSQTSTIQIRTMENRKPPIRIVSVGRVYRPDEIDDTHHLMFHQMEGLMVGPDVTMASLKTVLRLFAAAYLGEDVHVRFRPSFFPFTEPSAEVDVECLFCGGDGCKVCGHSGWLEILGAGMVHPNVLENCGIDSEKYTGFAFGMGVERITQIKYQVNDLRLYSQNDVRFLRQFQGI
jgi:phenylalanyl-tRNA synthetase alpha chain